MWRRTHHTRTPASASLVHFQEDKQVDTLQDQHALLQWFGKLLLVCTFWWRNKVMIVLSLEQLYLPSFNRAMSFVWFEKFSWTITLLTRICFLLKMIKTKTKKAKEVYKRNSTFVLPDLCYGHEVQGWRRWLLRARALQCNFPWLTVMIYFDPS